MNYLQRDEISAISAYDADGAPESQRKTRWSRLKYHILLAFNLVKYQYGIEHLIFQSNKLAMYHKKRQRNVVEETLFQYHLMTEKKEWG